MVSSECLCGVLVVGKDSCGDVVSDCVGDELMVVRADGEGNGNGVDVGCDEVLRERRLRSEASMCDVVVTGQKPCRRTVMKGEGMSGDDLPESAPSSEELRDCVMRC